MLPPLQMKHPPYHNTAATAQKRLNENRSPLSQQFYWLLILQVCWLALMQEERKGTIKYNRRFWADLFSTQSAAGLPEQHTNCASPARSFETWRSAQNPCKTLNQEPRAELPSQGACSQSSDLIAVGHSLIGSSSWLSAVDEIHAHILTTWNLC